MDLWQPTAPLDRVGDKGVAASARWHTAPRRVVHLAETPAGALLEARVHLIATTVVAQHASDARLFRVRARPGPARSA
jgi:hypothetical protein